MAIISKQIPIIQFLVELFLLSIKLVISTLLSVMTLDILMT
jgi:hypothetical protein